MQGIHRLTIEKAKKMESHETRTENDIKLSLLYCKEKKDVSKFFIWIQTFNNCKVEKIFIWIQTFNNLKLDSATSDLFKKQKKNSQSFFPIPWDIL